MIPTAPMPEIDEPAEGVQQEGDGLSAFDILCALAMLSVPPLIWLFAAT